MLQPEKKKKQRREPLRLTRMGALGALWIVCKLARAGPEAGRALAAAACSQQTAGSLAAQALE